MSVRQNLYRILKIKASDIAKAPALNVGSIPYQKALDAHELVSIGDNMVFAEIRRLKGNQKTPDELFSLIASMRRGLKHHRAAGRKKEARIVASAIDSMLFVPEVVDIIVDGPKSDFDAFRVRGFSCNGRHYGYLCSGAGQIRRNTATFIDSSIRDAVVKALDCGLDEKTKEFPLAKYTAYFALSFSSVLWVREPRVCVIKDFERVVKDQDVDFIVRDGEGNLSLERRKMDLPLNCADGQGLIDPEFAHLWAKDMGVGYQPCSFVTRSCFVKGNLATFDFRSYAIEHGITEIRDRWGVPHNIMDIDVLLSESQFKTCKYYSGWDEYLAYAHRGGVMWGVARYNKKEDADCVLANYQYLQALTLSDEDVRGLIQPTVDWIKGICTGDRLPALLFLLGAQDPFADEGKLFSDQYASAKTAAMRCVAKDPRFLDDDYVRRRIYKAIKGIIKRAKLGKIWVRGNYEFMVSDPIAQCQSALGLDPVGGLKAGEMWSGWWNDHHPTDRIACFRSPLIDQSETGIVKLAPKDDPELSNWYRYMNSGIIFNTYDTMTYRTSDSDFDGDLVFTTDNPFIIKGSHPEMPVITYEKGKAGPAPMTVQNITKTAEKGFGTGVGGFSNCATCLYAMAAEFNPDNPDRKAQYDECMRRIKLLRQVVGQEIDRIKGADKPHLPKEWRTVEKISPEMTDEQKKSVYRHNAIVIAKKPYFFRYLYPELDKRYRRYEESYDQVCQATFGMGIKALLAKKERSEDETNLIRRYRKYNPLITSNCTMNKLCRAFESQDFDIRFAKPAPPPDGSRGKPVSMLPDFPQAYPSDQRKISALRKVYRFYRTRQRRRILESTFDGMTLGEDASAAYQEALSLTLDADLDEARKRLIGLRMTPWEFCTLCHRLAETDRGFDWSFVWDLSGPDLADWVSYGTPLCAVEDPSGVEILGHHYVLRECHDEEGEFYDKWSVRLLLGSPKNGEGDAK